MSHCMCNQYLVLKLLHRQFHPADSTWVHWVHRHVYLITLEGYVASIHWTSLRRMLPTYRAMTMVQLWDSTRMSFWEDSWLPEGSLTEFLRDLYSHATRPKLSVQMVLQNSIDTHLQPRLTRAGTADHAKLA